MTLTTSPTDLMTMDAFIQLAQHERFELINGERKLLMPPLYTHSWIIRFLMRIMDAFAQQHSLGQMFSETVFVIAYAPNWVKGSRIPDLMFFTQARWDAYTAQTAGYRNMPIALVPDLVIEVISPTDIHREVMNKVDVYLQDGVKTVWLLDSDARRVMVYGGGQYHSYDESAILEEKTLFPGLQIALKDVFAVI